MQFAPVFVEQSPQHADVSTSSTSSYRDKRGSDPKSGGRPRVNSSSFKKSDDSGIPGVTIYFNMHAEYYCSVSEIQAVTQIEDGFYRCL